MLLFGVTGVREIPQTRRFQRGEELSEAFSGEDARFLQRSLNGREAVGTQGICEVCKA